MSRIEDAGWDSGFHANRLKAMSPAMIGCHVWVRHKGASELGKPVFRPPAMILADFPMLAGSIENGLCAGGVGSVIRALDY